jgi:hypothetical protein
MAGSEFEHAFAHCQDGGFEFARLRVDAQYRDQAVGGTVKSNEGIGNAAVAASKEFNDQGFKLRSDSTQTGLFGQLSSPVFKLQQQAP